MSKAQQTPLLELELLKTLVAIADTGNFSSAADSIFRTPSAVSMQIKRLEEMVGKPLFTRDSRTVAPTAEGEVLLEHGRRMLALNQDMVVRFMDPDIQGTVKLGAPDDVAERLLPNMLQRFSTTHCCVNVDVFVDSSNNLRKKIKNKELDLCLLASSIENAKKKGSEVVFREPLVWAGAKNGIAWEKDPLPISVWEESCPWRAVALDSLKKSKRNYRIAFKSAAISGQRAAMLADLAVAPVPLSACTNGIMRLTKDHGLPSLRDYVLVLDVSSRPSAAVKAAAEHLRTSLKEGR